MTIKLIKSETKSKTGGDQQRIELSDGSLFSFRICYLPQEVSSGAAAEGAEISAAEEAAFRHASACLRAEKTALKLIARAEQTCFGLARKLEKRGHEAACVRAALARLADLRLVDDRRFAQLWLESRLRLTRSPRRLLSALCGRGIDRGDAQAALKSILDDETEFAMLSRFAKKYSRMQKQPVKYLLRSEGFSRQAIQKFLDEESTTSVNFSDY